MAKARTTLNVSFSNVDRDTEQKVRRVSSSSVGFLSSSLPTAETRSVARKQSSSLVPNWHNNNGNTDKAETQVIAQRRLSKVGRNHFLRSFGKDTLYGYQGVDDVLPGKNEDISEKQKQHLLEFIDKKDELETQALNNSKKSEHHVPRVASAFPGSRSSMDSKWLYQGILETRGKDYSVYNGDLCVALKERIRSQSAKRRVRRIMLAEKDEKAEQENATDEETNNQPVRRTFRGATYKLIALNSFLEKKKWLAETRRKKKQLAIEKFYRASIVVRILCKLSKVITSLSTHKTPMTAAQKSWHALKHTSEAKEILFNMTIFLKGKSQYAYVPEWTKSILSKSPMERTDAELTQLHAVLKGLQSYDKFTYRIQMAMCRTMTYQRVEHGRILLRKGHEGLAFYFIYSGSAFVNVEELRKQLGHVVWYTATVLHRGDSFGELALLRKIKRTATVAVREDIELLVIDRDVLAITCPKIYDKELDDKIQFCKNLNIFQVWNDDMLRNICYEAQIQDWKSNKIILKDSSKETEWMYICMQYDCEVLALYICMQGKCSIIKVLDLKCPRVFRPKRVTSDDSYIKLFGKTPRSSVISASAWKKELENSFKQPFNTDKKVDETNESKNEIESESDESQTEKEDSRSGGKSAKERIITVMDLSYANMPHAKGDSQYCEVDDNKDDSTTSSAEYKDDQLQMVSKERVESNPLSLLDLVRLTNASGRLNKEIVYLDIASMQPGDIFDLSETLMPTGRKLMLISKGAILLRIKITDFLRYSTKSALKCARDIALQTDHPLSHPSPLSSRPSHPLSHPSPLSSRSSSPLSHPSPLSSRPSPPLFHPSPLSSRPSHPLFHPSPLSSRPSHPLFHPRPLSSRPSHPLFHPSPLSSRPSHPLFHPSPLSSRPSHPLFHPSPLSSRPSHPLFHPSPLSSRPSHPLFHPSPLSSRPSHPLFHPSPLSSRPSHPLFHPSPLSSRPSHPLFHPSPLSSRPSHPLFHPSPLSSRPSHPLFQPSPLSSHPSAPLSHPSPLSSHPSSPLSHPSPLSSRPSSLLSHPSPLSSRSSSPLSHPSPLSSHPSSPLSHPSPLSSHPSSPLSHPSPLSSHPSSPLSHPSPLSSRPSPPLFHP
ncbi:hypothetical protein QZH41_017365, partial [Actinostola sp. cb2023]